MPREDDIDFEKEWKKFVAKTGGRFFSPVSVRSELFIVWLKLGMIVENDDEEYIKHYKIMMQEFRIADKYLY